MRATIGSWLRTLANRIDLAGAPRALHLSFTFERGEGIRIRQDGKGCRLWYLGENDYDKAHIESDTLKWWAKYGV
jgi:hypothetical protein